MNKTAGAERAHALLSPSGAARWLACTPSALLEAQFPDKAGAAAEEGTKAHACCEELLRRRLAQPPSTKTTADTAFDPEMLHHAEEYAAFVMETKNALEEAAGGLAFAAVETRVSLCQYIPDSFGTVDCLLIADGRLIVIDYKYGKGVPVSAARNKQMMLYALGALEEFAGIYEVAHIRMIIYQPRIDNISSDEITAQELRAWAEKELKPRAAMAFAGDGDFVVGEHCRFCKARARCRQYADTQLEITKYEFRAPDLLSDAEMANVLTKAAEVKSWLTAVEEYALSEALEGRAWGGFKLVAGRSVRQIADPDQAVTALIAAGTPEALLYERKLLGITALEKAVGKKQFAEVLGDLIIKPEGKPTLVPESDKRPAIRSLAAAAADFDLSEPE